MIKSGAPRENARRGLLRDLAERARLLKRDTCAMYLAVRHPRTPWYAKVLAAAVVRLMPGDVPADCRAQAQTPMDRPVSWVGAAFMIVTWLAFASWLLFALRGLLFR